MMGSSWNDLSVTYTNKVRKSTMNNRYKICGTCKKEFFKATHHSYKIDSIYYCSYKCTQKARALK